MSALCFYFQVHQPYRLRHYTFFDIGVDSFYEDEDANCGIMLKVARKCYLPMNALLLKLIRKYDGRFKVSFSISGTALDQFEAYAPEVIQSFRELVAARVKQIRAAPDAWSCFPRRTTIRWRFCIPRRSSGNRSPCTTSGSKRSSA